MNTIKNNIQKVFFILTLVFALNSNAQSVAINTDGSTADPSAILDLKSTSQGVLVPRLTQSQRTIISAPATGLMVYQTDGTAGFYFYNGTSWTSLSASGAQGPQGPQGPDGAQGPQGPAGTNGADGKTILSGTGLPTTTTGTNGDFYINTTSNTLFGPKASGAWPATGVSLVGPAGATGAQGAAGQGVPTGGTTGQVLAKTDDTNYNTQWVNPASGGSSGGITLVTEAQKNALASATNGTLVYQTDGYKGIYAKESDGWRMQSGDRPITFINLGNMGPSTYQGSIIALNASHHTLYVEGSWDNYPFPLFTLPAASSCKGRIYTFYVLNTQLSTSQYGEPYTEDGYGVLFSGSDQYIQLDKSPFATPAVRGSSIIPTHRQFAVQSDGTNWREILNDHGTPNSFDLVGDE